MLRILLRFYGCVKAIIDINHLFYLLDISVYDAGAASSWQDGGKKEIRERELLHQN